MTKYIQPASKIVRAYVANNSLPPSDLPLIISEVHAALTSVAERQPSTSALGPAVNPKRSVFTDHIICLEDGKKFSSLRRHLQAYHDLTPEEYREKWNLPPSYPMVAPSFSESRSALAKVSGLGKSLRGKRMRAKSTRSG